jgi:hypothetical protein
VNPILTRATIKDLPELLELIREFYAIDGHTFDERRMMDCLPASLHTDDHGLV